MFSDCGRQPLWKGHSAIAPPTKGVATPRLRTAALSHGRNQLLVLLACTLRCAKSKAPICEYTFVNEWVGEFSDPFANLNPPLHTHTQAHVWETSFAQMQRHSHRCVQMLSWLIGLTILRQGGRYGVIMTLNTVKNTSWRHLGGWRRNVAASLRPTSLGYISTAQASLFQNKQKATYANNTSWNHQELHEQGYVDPMCSLYVNT